MQQDSILSRMKAPILFIICIILSGIVMPIMYYYWIEMGSGNVNFYYFISLLYSGAQVGLLIDAFNTHIWKKIEQLNPKIPIEDIQQRNG